MSLIGGDAVGHRIGLPGRPGESVVLDWAARSDVGRRRAVNEDSALATPPLFAVADGMGGHAAGHLASAAVVERLALAELRTGTLDLQQVEAALEAAAHDIDEMAEGVPAGIGTTVAGAALLLREEHPVFAVFNIGDSRVYSFADGELRQVTVDHSVVQELVDAGLLDAADAENHPESNVITRAIGFREAPRPDVWTVPVRKGLRLLICSDGLTRELGAERLRAHLAVGAPASTTAAALLEEALEAGGRDNITVLVVDVVDAPEPRPRGRHRVGDAPDPSGGGPA